MKHALRSRKGKKPEKMCPVVIRGQSLEYKPWQNTDMSDILEKLPTLQDGAHPWISKLEEIMVGTQPAIGDIKRLLANLLGVPAMEEILQKAGLDRYVGTAVNDPELFSANRGRVWRALRDTFLTNVHPDNIFIEPLGEEENPRAYVSRAQVWRNVTGHDPDFNQMEQSILRAKIQKGLPQPVRSKLAEVVGLGSMGKGVYTDHIAHQVELYRKKEHDQKEQDQEILRKLNQMQLLDNKKEKKQALVIQNHIDHKIDRDDYLRKEFDIEKSVPHVTLLVSEGYEQKHIGEMMAEAEEAVFLSVKENLAIWRSEDQRFIKIMITAQGQGQPQTVRMTHESLCSVTMASDLKREEMLRQVPE
ncbi:hypothetical protein MHYP_G00167470 [Metynnis hypsauchen]